MGATFTANTPDPAAVASIAITPLLTVLDVGQTAPLTAVTRAADNSVLTGRTITWSSSNNSLATVSAAGVVSAVAFGDTVRITATSEGISSTAAVFVRAPGVTIVASDANASESGPDNGAFTLSRTGPTTAALAVNLSITGSATNGVDYTAIPVSATFGVGQSTTVVQILPLADGQVEGAETVVMTVATGAYSVGVPSSATVTIADATVSAGNPVVTVIATDGNASENGSDNGTFTVSRTGLVTNALTVNIAMSGSATNGLDYVAVASTVTIPAGQASATVGVTPLADALTEGDENATLTVVSGTGYDIGASSSATIVIADVTPAPGKPVVSVATQNGDAAEVGPVNGSFVVSRTGATTAALTVNYAMSGTASNGFDYSTLSGSVVIPAGASSTTIVVAPLPDMLTEGSETVIITLSTNAAYDLGISSSALLTIADAVAIKPVVTVVASDANASEVGLDAGTFVITRTGSNVSALSVAIALTGTATNGVDYATVQSPITIPAGQSSVSVTVTPLSDALVESAETVVLTVATSAAYDVGTPNTATVTIADAGVPLPVVTVVATDANAAEGGADNGAFTVTRTGATTAVLTISLTMTGTAVNGTDYTSIAPTVVIPAGQASVVVTVTPLADALTESAETVIMTIAANAAYSVGSPNAATVTIVDAGVPLPVVTVVATDATAAEGGADNGAFAVTRTGATTGALTVSLTMSGTAVNGTDYSTIGSTIVIPVGQASAVVAVTPLADALTESAETVIMTIAANASYEVGTPNTATVTIADAVAPLPVITVVATDAIAAEGGTDNGAFTVTRTGATTAALTVNLTLSGTAVNGTDYSTITSTAVFPVGQTSVVVAVTPLADALTESAETVIMTIAANAAYSVGSPNTATVMIADAPIPVGGSLTNGATVTGRIAVKAQTHSWTFTATQGERIVVSAGETGTPTSDFAPWLQLMSPTGVLVQQHYSSRAAQVDVSAPVTGTYTVIVGSGDSGADGIGDYLLTLVKSPGALTVTAGDQGGDLSNGATHTGSIYVGDVDAWTFTAAQGEHLVIALGETGTVNADFAPWLRLISPTGAVVQQHYSAYAAQVEVSAPVSGTYTVIVGSGDSGIDGLGDYRLSLIKAPGVLTVSPGDQGGAITNGATHAGTIYLGDVDSWTFTAVQGEHVVIALGETGTVNNDFAPWLRLISPTGAVVQQHYSSYAAQLEASAPVSGTYTVIVGSGDSGIDGLGDYRLTLIKAPGGLTVSPSDQGGDMTNGATHTGSIYLGDVDSWTFSATQGEHLVIAMGETGTVNPDFAPWLRLVSPTGAVVQQHYSSFAAQLEASAPVSGTYTVIVGSGDSGTDGVGDYRLTLAKAPGTLTVSPDDQGGPMTNGATHTGTIYLGDVDTWTFTATQGERIVIAMGEVAPLTAEFAPWLRLVGPTGAVVAQHYSSFAAQVDVAAPISGAYTVIVGSGDSGTDGVGDYRLTLVRAPGTLTVSPGDQGGPMTNGVTHTGSIYMGDVDTWTFTATQGERIIIGMGETAPVAPEFAPWIRLIGPTGAVVDQHYSSFAAQVDLAAPNSGTYTVIVGSGDSGTDGVGDYKLTLLKVPGALTVSPGDQGGAMTDGVTHTGTIEVGDVDAWTFSGGAGQRIIVNMTETGTVTTTFGPWIRIFGPTGAFVVQHYNSSTAQVDFLLPSTGTYTVIVGSGDSGTSGVGGYNLRLTRP